MGLKLIFILKSKQRSPRHSSKFSSLPRLKPQSKLQQMTFFIYLFIFFFFRVKPSPYISCESSAKQTIHMKFHYLFSLKNKKIKILEYFAWSFETLYWVLSACLKILLQILSGALKLYIGTPLFIILPVLKFEKNPLYYVLLCLKKLLHEWQTV